MDKIVIASNNKKKISELSFILNKFGIKTLSLADVGFNSEIIEDGNTFEENAIIKAKTVYEFAKLPTLSDDSGLCVDALGGAPSIHSARYAGEGASDTDRNNLLLENLKGVEDRKAKFVCCIAFYDEDGKCFTFSGEISGDILTAPQGENGFGYDPIFFVQEYNKSFAELPSSIKNNISHRAKALLKFEQQIKKHIEKRKKC